MKKRAAMSGRTMAASASCVSRSRVRNCCASASGDCLSSTGMALAVQTMVCRFREVLSMERHPPDFFEGGLSAHHQFQCRFAQAARAVGTGSFLDLADRPLVDDQFADLVVEQ